jgi:CubicO group peptidase (beta-lactamase class C family)
MMTKSRLSGIAVLVLCAAQAAMGEAGPQGAEKQDAEKLNAALKKLDAFIAETMAKTKVPGLAVAVVYGDKTVFAQGYGVRRLGDPAGVNADTVFEIASVSKPLASTVVASLVGTGDVSWDDHIAKLDPDFALSDKEATAQVTVRDLFAHRSGLPTGGGDVLEDLGYSRPEILSRIRYVPLAGAMGKTYHYSNFGLTEGATAAVRKTGKTWEEISEQRLYARIGMTSTSSRYSDYENNPNKAALHVLWDGEYRNWFVRKADAEAPAGGVSSSVNDLAKWISLQLNAGKFNGEQVVEAKALEETHKAQICSAEAGPIAMDKCPGDHFYGLGWNVGKTEDGKLQLGHSGAFLLGTSTSVYMIPEEHVGIVVLVNGTPTGVAESVCLTFLDYFHYGEQKRDYMALIKPIFDGMMKEGQDVSKDYATIVAPEKPAAAKDLASYAGMYVSQFYGALRIEVKGDRLVLRLPPRESYHELTHWDGDTFTYYFASENTGIARRGVKFLDGGNKVLIENLAIENDGVFTKVN